MTRVLATVFGVLMLLFGGVAVVFGGFLLTHDTYDTDRIQFVIRGIILIGAGLALGYAGWWLLRFDSVGTLVLSTGALALAGLLPHESLFGGGVGLLFNLVLLLAALVVGIFTLVLRWSNAGPASRGKRAKGRARPR
jgi:hypothetical protein